MAIDWRKLLTRQSDTWNEKSLPMKSENSQQYASEWDRLNHYNPVRYAWDQRNKEKE